MILKKGYLLKAFLIFGIIITCWQLEATWQHYDQLGAVVNSEGPGPGDGLNEEPGQEINDNQTFEWRIESGVDFREVRFIKERNIFINNIPERSMQDKGERQVEDPVYIAPENTKIEIIPEEPPSSDLVIPDSNFEKESQVGYRPLPNPFTLLAVSVKEASPRAIIINKDNGVTYIVKPGGIIEGYQVREIKKDRVVLSRDKGQITVNFRDKNF